MRRPAIVSVGTVAIVVVVAAAFNLLTSRGAIREQLEAVLTATFETPVTIGKLETHLLPYAMLTARQITFARRDSSPNLSVVAVHVDVSLSQIWRGELVISDLRLEDVTGGLEGLMHYLGRMSEPTDGESPVQMAWGRIRASPVRLRSHEGRKLGPYELDVRFGPEGKLMAVSIARLDSPVRLHMARGDPGSVDFGFTARDWRIPYGPPLKFDRVEAVGRWVKDEEELQIDDLRVGAYGGALAGQARLGWGSEWLLKGQAVLEGVDAGAFLAELGRPALTGRLNWDVAFELRAQELRRLLERPELAGDFVLKDGALGTGRGANDKSASGKPLPFEELAGQIRYKTRHLQIRSLKARVPVLSRRRVGPYDVSVQTTQGGGLRSASVRREDGRASLLISPADSGHEVTFKARRWTLPAGPPLEIDRLVLAGRLVRGDHLLLDRISGRLYGGQVEGQGSFGWRDRWTLDVKGKVVNVDMEPLLAVFGKRSLAGRFYATGETRLVSKRASRLFKRPIVYCDFSVLDGAVYEVDLQRATQNLSDDYVTGGETGFNKLSGRLYLENDMLTVDDMWLKSAAFEAKGQLAVDPRDKLHGEINVGLREVSTLVGIPVRISGTSQEPRLRPTNAAIAGAAAGTAVLGPGLGTALGIKAGQAVKKLSEFLGRAAERARAE